jgi:hypothetical protein
VLLSNISHIVKDISHLSLYRVEYKSINNKLVFNLNLLVLKYKEDAIYKRIRVFKLIIIKLLGLLGSKVLY